MCIILQSANAHEQPCPFVNDGSVRGHRIPTETACGRPLIGAAIVLLRNSLIANKADGAYAALLAAQKNCSGWTAFSRDDYVAHIKALRLFLGDRPMRMIEQHWSPHD